MKDMTEEEAMAMAMEHTMGVKEAIPYLPTADLLLVYQVLPEKVGTIVIPEHARKTAKGAVNIVLACGPEVSETIKPGMKVTIGTGSSNERHISMDDGFFILSANTVVCINNPYFVEEEESAIVSIQ